MQTWFVTGGAGFIGANFVLAGAPVAAGAHRQPRLLTYAGHPENLDGLASPGVDEAGRAGSERSKADRYHVFVRGDIGDEALVARLFAEHKPVAVVNFAAESHVDRSILGPQAFIQTNIVGTHTLLAAARGYWQGLEAGAKRAFRFLHVSTDEVYGSLGPKDPAFTE